MIYTSGVKTEPIMDLNSMVGKMNVLKDLIYTAAGKPGSTEPIWTDEEQYIVDRMDNVNKSCPTKLIMVGDGGEEHIPDIFEVSGRENELLEFNEVDGFPFYGVAIGDGYFDKGMFAIIITDGTNLYTYVPLKGNSYNPTKMEAFDSSVIDAEVDKDMIYEDIREAFYIGVKTSGSTIPTATTPSKEEEDDDAVTAISDSIDEVVEAVEALTDDETGAFLRDGMENILESIKKVISDAKSGASSDLSSLNTKIAALEVDKKKLEDELTTLSDEFTKTATELASLKSGATTVSSAEADAFKDIAKIVAAVTGGAVATPSTTPTAPTAPAKPLKKITLPTKTIAFEYVYGVEMDGSTAVLHIIKKDDWARDEFAKEGRVDTDTVARLKAEVPMKRDKFLYILENTYSTVDEVVDEISKVSGINMVHSADVQAKL